MEERGTTVKIANISPPEHINTLRRRGYHMALAQYLGRQPAYLDMYKQLNRMGMFIIVDNGAAEGVPMEWHDVVTFANLIHADEVVMSDTMKDGPKTLELAKSIQAENLISPNRRMAVPQGSTWEEWEECLQLLTMYCDFTSIGIPKHLEGLEGGRVHALEHIMTGEYGYFNIHLLGCHGNPIREIKTLKRFGFVRGIDTGAAVAYAQHGILLNEHDDEVVLEHKSLSWDMPADAEIVLQNIFTLEQVSNGL